MKIEEFSQDDFQKASKRIIRFLTRGKTTSSQPRAIRDVQGVMVGRINLSVLGSDRKTAELGYRIGEKYTNLGYASEAVKLVLDKAFHTYGLNRIIAGTATDNLASKRVLLKNGFTFIRIIENDLQMNNEWIHTAVFEITNL
ncbi:acetyltransferase domain protein [Streptococcus sanguinis]|nr:GNAT family N-acetyltransferase [Streptococcus sanguinis]MCC3173890.1 acetyltransferase domain protein [Streptococcus sanguinis]